MCFVYVSHPEYPNLPISLHTHVWVYFSIRQDGPLPSSPSHNASALAPQQEAQTTTRQSPTSPVTIDPSIHPSSSYGHVPVAVATPSDTRTSTRAAHGSPLTDAAAADATVLTREVAQLKDTVRQRDNEIAVLVAKLKRERATHADSIDTTQSTRAMVARSDSITIDTSTRSALGQSGSIRNCTSPRLSFAERETHADSIDTDSTRRSALAHPAFTTHRPSQGGQSGSSHTSSKPSVNAASAHRLERSATMPAVATPSHGSIHDATDTGSIQKQGRSPTIVEETVASTQSRLAAQRTFHPSLSPSSRAHSKSSTSSVLSNLRETAISWKY